MQHTNRHLTGMILAASAIVFGGFFFFRGAVKNYQQVDPDISYSMPRPTKNTLFTWLFGLEGREVQYKEVNPFNDKTSTAAGSVRKDQKNAAKIDAKKAAAKNAKASTPIAAPKKPEVKVNVVNAAPQDSMRGSASAPMDSNSGGAVAAQAAVTAQQAQPNNSTPAEVMSSAQWRALLLGQPSKENVAKLVTAFNKHEVDVATLYLIMNDLLQSSNSDTQSAGLSIAQNIPSLKSFSLVAENYDKLSTSGKAAADAYFLTYMQSSRLSILALALKSTEPVVVQHAVQVMAKGLQNVAAGNPTDPRGGRGVVSTGTKGSNYLQFIPILQQLIQGSDSSVSGLAQSALTQIQSLSNA